MANFNSAIGVVLQHEGGYVNDPHDAGGETNFGICKRDYPNVDIANLTVGQATDIYKTDWWDKYNFQSITDDELATYYFDHAVNAGIHAVTVAVQRVVGAVVDGQIGPHTIATINKNYVPSMLPTLKDTLWQHYLKILAVHPEDEKFRNGWHNRVYSA
jgi:lysozyme family protein